MNKIIIGRPINGISLNGNEYILDENEEVKVFDSQEDAKEFLIKAGYSKEELQDDLDNCRIVFCNAETQEVL